jgi:TPR repeat protein
MINFGIRGHARVGVHMLKFVQNLFNLNSALLQNAQAVTLYDEALALHGAKEYRKAFPLMKEAAELGNSQAQSVLGSMYLLGQGTKENGQEAERWLKQAVEVGFDDAVGLLGMAYATGKAGMKINIPLARELLAKAASKGDAQSAQMLEMIAKGEGRFGKRKARR